MSSVNGPYDTPLIDLEDLNSRFEAYEEGVRSNYLFVNVWSCVNLVLTCRIWLNRWNG